MIEFTDFTKIMEELDEDLSGISIDNKCVVMTWNGSEYIVPLNRVKSWAALAKWMIHLCEKKWMTPNRLKLFAATIIAHKGWIIKYT